MGRFGRGLRVFRFMRVRELRWRLRRLSICIKPFHLVLSLVIIVLLALLFVQPRILYGKDDGCRSDCCNNIGSFCEKCEYIDVVYTWVNGSDPAFLESMRKFAEHDGISKEDDLSPSRFDDKQELKYSLRSLEKYAPWIRRVFLVTAGQLPSWLNLQDGWGKNGKSKLTLISHEDIIPEEYLPTFSSPAIECFLHKIPGLSNRFLYFNDDIFLGDSLHLNDLYTPSDGYIVYTAWSVPECAQGCPWSFLGDNSCDQSCNNVECDYDGGDCLGNPQPNNHHLDYLGDYADNPFFDEDEKGDYGDGKNIDKYPGVKEAIDSKVARAQHLKDGKLLNLLTNKKDNSLRKLQSISNLGNYPKYFFYNNHHNNYIGSNFNVKFQKKILLRKLRSVQLIDPEIKKRYLESLKTTVLQNNSFNLINVTKNKTNLPNEKLVNIYNNNLEVSSHNENGQKNTTVNVTNSKNRISQILKVDKFRNISDIVLNFNNNVMNNNKYNKKRNVSVNGSSDAVKRDSRQQYGDNRRLDVYARSLIHTNKIFNKVYGFQNRKVPAHIPFLMEKKVIEKMQIKFAEHIEVTKRNKFRRPNDFQFAFAYFHYMMSERDEYTIEEIFDKYDTDKSGTWSDREVRTILARVRGPPLTAEAVHAMEMVAKGCDSEEHRSHPTPPNERYLDSDMPTLTKKLIIECPGLKNPLIGALSLQKPKAHPRSAAGVATFAMLSSNITKAVVALDEIRRDTKKFICINDNLDPSHESEAEIVRMVLQELYEALLPLPSQWELPPHVANRFLRLEDLTAWQNSRTIAYRALIACAILLLFLTIQQTKCLRFISSTINKYNK